MEMKESLTAQIAAKGEEIKAAKAAKVDKAALQPLIDALLALKAEYEVVVGEPFPNPNARGGKKKKVGGSAGGGGVGGQSAVATAGDAREARRQKLSTGAPNPNVARSIGS